MRREYDDLVAVKFLCDQMGDQWPFKLNWEECPDGGLETQVNGVIVQIWGSEASLIRLRMIADRKEHVINEPVMPRESVRKFLGSLKLSGWFTNSKTKEEEENKSELRKCLEILLERSHQQYFRSQADYEERHEQSRQEILNKLLGKNS